jgi:hypothetical protein
MNKKHTTKCPTHQQIQFTKANVSTTENYIKLEVPNHKTTTKVKNVTVQNREGQKQAIELNSKVKLKMTQVYNQIHNSECKPITTEAGHQKQKHTWLKL